MNTIKEPTSVMPTGPKIIRKLALCILSTAIIGAVYITTGSNANAFSNERKLLSSRSAPVKYDEKTSKQNVSRNAQGINEAQHTALDALNRLDLTAATTEEPRKNREQVMAERKNKLIAKKGSLATSSSQSAQSSRYLKFDLYGASSRLFEDFDYDGFYQTFSVTFDADVYGQYAGVRARVFADLYLSIDGGPWELYFTTDAFTIVDNTSDDEFEVLTTLDLGYITAHYDVLVDLYEVGYGEVVATISSEDIADLYALPLESSDRDEYTIIDTYSSDVVISAGSFSISGLLILLCAIGLRFSNRCKTKSQ